ncbi:MAG TPA: lipid II flippase MurJ [Actinomycetota bacterium]|nr:lipid II flippase MurJ [Actinomycetota bacterium]
MQPPDEIGTETGLLRSTAQVSAITALARLVGFARWIVLGLTVGTTYLGNVYQTANWIPNILFEVAAGGVLAAVLVPTFVEEIARRPDQGMRVASAIANTMLLASLPLVVAGVVLGRPIMGALLAGVEDAAVRERQVELGTWFLRFFLPQIPLYLLGMVMQGILHAHRRFVLPALAPLLSSLTVIATYVIFWALGPGATLETVTIAQLYVLAVGTTLGVVVLSLCQLPAVLRLGVRWRPVLGLGDPALRYAVRAGGWGAVYVAVTQAGLIVSLLLANRVEGGVVAFQIAYAFFELPNALAGLPVAITLFPSLARAFVERQEERFAELLSKGWRIVVLVAAPAAAGLFVLAPTLTDALLGWTPSADGSLVAATLRGLALGVPAWALVATLSRSFYARQRTAPPVVMNATAMAVYAATAFGITWVTGVTGPLAMGVLGLGLGVGHVAGAAVGTGLLARAVRGWPTRTDLAAVAATLVRSAAVGAAALAVTRLMDGLPSALVAASGVAAGLVVFAVLAHRSPDLRGAAGLLTRGRAPLGERTT